MTFQEQLDALRREQAPIPMRGMQEITQALRLRKAGLTYGGIAIAMRVYHGSERSGAAWREQLRKHGAVPVHYSSGRLREFPPNARPSSTRASDARPAPSASSTDPIHAPAPVEGGRDVRAAGAQS